MTTTRRVAPAKAAKPMTGPSHRRMRPGATRGYHTIGSFKRYYLTRIPKGRNGILLAGDRVLAHNGFPPMQTMSLHGFRAWSQVPDPEGLVVCLCGWAPELGVHHRVLQGGATT